MRELVERYSRDLANTERMSLRDLKHYQERSLVWLVRHARNQLPFYRSRLDALFKADGEVDLSRWNEVPILRRDEVSAYGREMRVSRLPAIYGAIRECRTSGTSGQPLEIASNEVVGLTS